MRTAKCASPLGGQAARRVHFVEGMAAIDSLLRVMVLRDAEAMTLTTGQVPSLRRGGNAEPMAMPVLDAGMVASFVGEVVPAEGRSELEARKSGEYVYRMSGGDAVAVMVEVVGNGGYRLVVRRGGGGGGSAVKVEAKPRMMMPSPSPRHDHDHDHVDGGVGGDEAAGGRGRRETSVGCVVE